MEISLRTNLLDGNVYNSTPQHGEYFVLIGFNTH